MLLVLYYIRPVSSARRASRWRPETTYINIVFRTLYRRSQINTAAVVVVVCERHAQREREREHAPHRINIRRGRVTARGAPIVVPPPPPPPPTYRGPTSRAVAAAESRAVISRVPPRSTGVFRRSSNKPTTFHNTFRSDMTVIGQSLLAVRVCAKSRPGQNLPNRSTKRRFQYENRSFITSFSTIEFRRRNRTGPPFFRDYAPTPTIPSQSRIKCNCRFSFVSTTRYSFL